MKQVKLTVEWDVLASSEDWWNAARSAVGRQEAPTIILHFFADWGVGEESIPCPADDLEEVIEWASELPGWHTGVKIAPHPFYVEYPDPPPPSKPEIFIEG